MAKLLSKQRFSGSNVRLVGKYVLPISVYRRRLKDGWNQDSPFSSFYANYRPSEPDYYRIIYGPLFAEIMKGFLSIIRRQESRFNNHSQSNWIASVN